MRQQADPCKYWKCPVLGMCKFENRTWIFDDNRTGIPIKTNIVKVMDAQEEHAPIAHAVQDTGCDQCLNKCLDDVQGWYIAIPIAQAGDSIVEI